MDGIKGLKVIEIVPNTISSTQIVCIKSVIILFIIVSIVFLLLTIKTKKESNIQILPSITLIILSGFLLLTTKIGIDNYEKEFQNNNIDYIYTLEIIDDNYFIDTNIYEILNIENNTIKAIK